MQYTVGAYLAARLSQIGLKHHFAVTALGVMHGRLAQRLTRPMARVTRPA